MSLEEKIDKMAKDIEELKAYLISKPDIVECQHEYDPIVFNMKDMIPICLKCHRQYIYQGR